jgi:hypothetical protein
MASSSFHGGSKRTAMFGKPELTLPQERENCTVGEKLLPPAGWHGASCLGQLFRFENDEQTQGCIARHCPQCSLYPRPLADKRRLNRLNSVDQEMHADAKL